MPIFRVQAHVTVSCETVVEAEDAEAAMDIAECRDLAPLPAFCFNGSPVTEVWHIDTDGTPFDVRVDEVEGELADFEE